MKTVCVIQHTEAEYLGLMEDHFEGRNIRFIYKRPFTAGGTLPTGPEGFDGLMLLGGGPYGIVSGHILPSLGPELRLASAFLKAGLPVVGFGLGALVLATAAGGGAAEAPLRFELLTAERTGLGDSFLQVPQYFPLAQYLRDEPVLPRGAVKIAVCSQGRPLVFSVNDNSLGFTGHPGMKRGMAEDLIMEFTETPPDTPCTLQALADAQIEIASVLNDLMVATVRHSGLMENAHMPG
ncbi:MAG: hypothetical protein KDJ48_02915 [Nitratireductor sp.]|nr:hypothetical protein [Nitratireductor sp.]MCB1458214.1 hypothetical protein [Nitratireductor sp.]